MSSEAGTPQDQVLEFYKAFKQALPPEGEKPSLENEVIKDRIHLKMSLIAEEFFELVAAVYGDSASKYIEGTWDSVMSLDDGTRDVVEAFDALADLEYVIAGMAIEAGGDLDAVFDNVHASNMSKLDENGEPILSDGVTPAPDGKVKPEGKILKGPNFWTPDIANILGL